MKREWQETAYGGFDLSGWRGQSDRSGMGRGRRPLSGSWLRHRASCRDAELYSVKNALSKRKQLEYTDNPIHGLRDPRGVRECEGMGYEGLRVPKEETLY